MNKETFKQMRGKADSFRSDLKTIESEVELIQKTFGWDRHTILGLPSIRRKTIVKFLQDVLQTRNFG